MFNKFFSHEMYLKRLRISQLLNLFYLNQYKNIMMSMINLNYFLQLTNVFKLEVLLFRRNSLSYVILVFNIVQIIFTLNIVNFFIFL